MEKVGVVEKKNRLVELLTTRKAKYIVGTILLSALGVTLPRIFHLLGGASSGATFLPMHIAILIAALSFGAISGSVVAGSSVIFSYLLTGMPNLARLPYMLIELVIYAILLSVLNKKFNSYVSLIATIIIGRVIYAGVLWTAINVLGLATYGISVVQSIQAGLPGLVIQLICVPFIAKSIQQVTKLEQDKNKNNR